MRDDKWYDTCCFSCSLKDVRPVRARLSGRSYVERYSLIGTVFILQVIFQLIFRATDRFGDDPFC